MKLVIEASMPSLNAGQGLWQGRTHGFTLVPVLVQLRDLVTACRRPTTRWN